jgi:hypothetical protein
MVDAMEAVLLCAAPISGGLCAKSGTLVAKRPCTLVKTASQYLCRSGLVGVIGSANRLAHRSPRSCKTINRRFLADIRPFDRARLCRLSAG